MRKKKRKIQEAEHQPKAPKKSKKKKSFTLSSAYDQRRNQYSAALIKSARAYRKHSGNSLPPVQVSSTRGSFANGERGDGGVSGATTKPSEDIECVICRNAVSQCTTLLPCGHKFCGPCIIYWFVLEKKIHDISSCPTCRAQVGQLQQDGVVSKVPYIPTPPRRRSRSAGSENRDKSSKKVRLGVRVRTMCMYRGHCHSFALMYVCVLG